MRFAAHVFLAVLAASTGLRNAAIAQNPGNPIVRINEWMAANSLWPDEAGAFGDWIELYNDSDAAVDLSGWFLTDNLNLPQNWRIPDGTTISPRGFLVFWADGRNQLNHATFKLAESGEAIGLATPDGAWHDAILFGPQTSDISEGRMPDGGQTIQALTRASPGAPNGGARIQANAGLVLLRTGAAWKYFDRGLDLGNAWRERFYEDFNWRVGNAQLGFGDGDESTLIEGGPTDRRFATTYFRNSFFVTNTPLLTGLNLRLLRDDGAAVYLNGVEIRRDNLPPGVLNYNTLAPAAVGGADETNFLTSAVSRAPLLDGQNTLAVEVHQASSNSTDLSFDLELIGVGSGLPGVISEPGFLSVPPGSCVRLEAPPFPGALGYQWLRNNKRIDGATGSTLDWCGAQSIDGGAYGVLVRQTNDVATVLEPAIVVVQAPAVQPIADFFFESMPLQGTNGVVQGNNANATRESGEPYHHGILGGRSMWFTWFAPSTGIVTFDTRGSSFDTVLAVYTGFALSNLSVVTGDDERGGYATSRVQFNAQANTQYRIVVDGFEGATGYFTLRWSFEATAATIPTILGASESQMVPAGGTAILSVSVGEANSTFQWLRNGQPILNAVSSSLVLSDLRADSLAAYTVLVRSASARFTEVIPGRVGIGECGQFYDRPWITLQPCRRSTAGGFAPAFVSLTNPPSSGVAGAMQLGELRYGRTPYSDNGGAFVCNGQTLWSPLYYDVDVQDEGFLILDTCGSSLPLRLGLYRKAPERFLEPANRLACDLISAGLGRPAVVAAQVSPGVYTVVLGRPISGAWPSDSTLRLNLRLSPNLHLRSRGAAPITLTVNTNRAEWAVTAATAFYWYKDGTFLAKTPAPNLTISDSTIRIQPAHVGTYDLHLSNAVNQIRIVPAADIIITNDPPVPFYRLRSNYSVDTELERTDLEARSHRPMWWEAAAPMITVPIVWTPLAGPTTNYHVLFTECNEGRHFQRYFRQRILSP